MATCDACGKEFDEGYSCDWMAGDETGREVTGTTVTASQKVTDYRVTYANVTPVPLAICMDCYKSRRSGWLPRIQVAIALALTVATVVFALFGRNDALWVLPVLPVLFLLAVGWEYLKKFAGPAVSGVAEVTRDIALEKCTQAGRHSTWAETARAITPAGESALTE